MCCLVFVYYIFLSFLCFVLFCLAAAVAVAVVHHAHKIKTTNKQKPLFLWQHQFNLQKTQPIQGRVLGSCPLQKKQNRQKQKDRNPKLTVKPRPTLSFLCFLAFLLFCFLAFLIDDRYKHKHKHCRTRHVSSENMWYMHLTNFVSLRGRFTMALECKQHRRNKVFGRRVWQRSTKT